MSELLPPNWFWIFAASTAIITLIFKLGKWFGIVNSDREQFREFMHKISHEVGEVQNNVSALQGDVVTLQKDVVILQNDVVTLKTDVSVLKSDVSVLKSDVSVLKSDLSTLKIEFGEFRKSIGEILLRLPAAPLADDSPLRLTDLGKRISSHIDANQWAQKTAKQLVDKTVSMDSFQVQEMSFQHSKEFEPDESMLKKMRESAFQEGLNLDGVRSVLGVVLRDELFRIRESEITTADSTPDED